MYTNNVMIYERAPHILIGFPTRYCERKVWTQNNEQMGSEAFLTPGYEATDYWVYGDCYPACNLIDSGRETYYLYCHTNDRTKGKPKELSACGYIYVDVLDEAGKPLSGQESFEIYGNNLDRRICFADGSDFAPYSGKPVRLRFRMCDAKLYAMWFA